MQREKKGKHFLKQPKFIGGQAALKKLVSNKLKYPKEALKRKIEGSVKVSYTIDNKGKVVEAKSLTKLGYGCDEEAIRVVKLFKFEVPKNRGVRVLFHKQITIHFRLPKQNKPSNSVAQKEKQTTGYQYHYTPSKEQKKGYVYTVTL